MKRNLSRMMQSVKRAESAAGAAPVFRAVLASDTPLLRQSADGQAYYEVLSHAEGSIDLSRQDVIPLLRNHDSKEQVGALRNFSVEAGQLLCDVVISRNFPDIAMDIEDGILNALSVGANTEAGAQTVSWGAGEELPTVTVQRWTLIEGSLVSIPADHTATFKRSADTPSSVIIELVKEPTTVEPTTIEPATIEPTTVEPTTSEPDKSESQDSCKEDYASESTKTADIQRSKSEKNADTLERAHSVSTTIKKEFEMNLNTILRALVSNDSAVIQDLGSKGDRGYNISRAFGTGDLAADPLARKTVAGPLIEKVIHASKLKYLGAMFLTDLTSEVKFPREAGDVSAVWYEDGSVPAATAQTTNIDMVTATPKHLFAQAIVSRNVLTNAAFDLEALIVKQVRNKFANAIDSAAIYGTGSAGSPTGIMSTAGILTHDFNGTAPSRSDFNAMEAALRLARSSTIESQGYLTDVHVATMLKDISYSGTNPGWLYEGTYDDGVINKTVKATTYGNLAVAGGEHTLILGDWSKLNVGIGSLSVDVDTTTPGIVKFNFYMDAMVAITAADAFVVADNLVVA